MIPVIGVYVIKCLITDKVYVGSSLDVQRRLKAHMSQLRNGAHRNTHLQRAWDKHGECGFKFEQVASASKELLIQLEQHWIDTLKAADARFGYNACPVAASVGSLPKTPEHRAKIGAAHKGTKRSEETRARISAAMSGKARGPMSAERRAKISAAKKGRPMSDSTKQKLSALKTGVKTGPCTEVRRASISAAKKRSNAEKRVNSVRLEK